MPEEMTCFACEQEPTQQCPRCGRPYCDDHGEDVCDACLEPSSGLPSFTLYRGSLLALLIGTALAVWLILQPPGETASSAVAPQVITPTEPRRHPDNRHRAYGHRYRHHHDLDNPGGSDHAARVAHGRVGPNHTVCAGHDHLHRAGG